MTIAATPEAVYSLITDLPTLAELAEEATAMEWHKGDCVECGAVFKGHNSGRPRAPSPTPNLAACSRST